MKIKKILVSLACVTALLSAVPVAAEGLEYSITPYLWGSGLDGSVQMGEVGGDLDVSFSDLASNMDIAVPIHFEAKGPVWTLIAEVFFVGLSTDLEMDLGTSDVDMFMAELLSGYQFSNHAELLFGARYTSLESELNFKGPGPGAGPSFEADQNWVDPVVGIRYGGPISRKWEFIIRFDAAGFGLGSDLTLNFRTGFGVNVSDVTRLTFGWHTMDIDYDDNDFVYDMTQQGPELAVTFKF